jgi:hypothetical protein
VLHLSIANRTGVVLDQREQIAAVLALNVHQFIVHWQRTKSLLVNWADATAYDTYLGKDCPDEVVKARLVSLNGAGSN